MIENKVEITSYQKMNDRICSLLVSNHSLACLYIDCSNMNKIEGHFGKKIYLDVLKKIHRLLLDIKGKYLRQDDIIVSNGVAGDEFFVFLAKKRYDRDFYPTDLESLCNRITALLNNSVNPVTIPYLRGRPKIAVGYAVIIHNPLIRDERLINKLTEDAKHMSTYQEFKRQMRNKEKLQELILKKSIKTVFQPVVDFTNNEIIGYEALTRGPEGTEYEYPYILFDVAEETDLLFELDRLCRKEAFQNARGINPKYKLFLNCQPSAVLDPEFRDSYLESLLEDSNINPFNVVLEVTEREAVKDYDLFKEAATYYSDIGFAIAIDDTGTGYSSLESVVELKPKYIKLDISLIRGIYKNILKQELIKAIVGLSKKMHSIVIAEGIEAEDELNTLKEIGINFGQGFFFAKPAPPFPDICR